MEGLGDRRGARRLIKVSGGLGIGWGAAPCALVVGEVWGCDGVLLLGVELSLGLCVEHHLLIRPLGEMLVRVEVGGRLGVWMLVLVGQRLLLGEIGWICRVKRGGLRRRLPLLLGGVWLCGCGLLGRIGRRGRVRWLVGDIWGRLTRRGVRGLEMVAGLHGYGGLDGGRGSRLPVVLCEKGHERGRRRGRRR
jgi:hypothetical protein